MKLKDRKFEEEQEEEEESFFGGYPATNLVMRTIQSGGKTTEGLTPKDSQGIGANEVEDDQDMRKTMKKERSLLDFDESNFALVS